MDQTDGFLSRVDRHQHTCFELLKFQWCRLKALRATRNQMAFEADMKRSPKLKLHNSMMWPEQGHCSEVACHWNPSTQPARLQMSLTTNLFRLSAVGLNRHI